MIVAGFMNEDVQNVSSDKSIAYASELMNERRVGSLLVVDHGATLGILTSRDIRTAHPNRIVADAMSTKLVSVPKSCFVWDALALMESHRIERVLVREAELVCGILTREEARAAVSLLTEPMTGLYRKDYVYAIAEDFIARRRPFHTVFVDLNRFGEINKTYGHPVGDDILVRYAGKIKAAVTPDDHVCRYGGDEFLIITQRDHEGTAALAADLSNVYTVGETDVTASIGIYHAYDGPEFYAKSFQEMITIASLSSSNKKPRQSAERP